MHTVFLMGFSNFATNWRQYVGIHPDINALFGDEWHLGFSTDAAQRTQSLYEFMDRTEILVAMTGTIINGRLDSAYPLIQICSPESYSGGWYDFQMTHAVENSYGQIVDWRHPGQVGEIFGKIAIRHSFESVYGPEAKEIQHELCMMDPKQREAYRRAIRGKRETPLLITVLEYENSMDQRIFTIIEKKSKLANAVDDTKERIKLRIATKVTSAT